MWATRSKISHTYIRSGNIVNQASGLEVNQVGYDYFLTYSDVVDELEIQITDEQYEAGQEFLRKSLGKPYSMLQLFGFGWVMINRSFGRKVHNPASNGDHSYICVELVARYLGIPDAEDLTPEDLYEMLTLSQLTQRP